MFIPEQHTFTLFIDVLNKINVKYYPGMYPAFKKSFEYEWSALSNGYFIG